MRASKVTNSENRAELYLSYKDHKKVPGKTRPIATGCSSNTLALSNSVSSLVESLANAEDEKHEVISTEDLLSNVGKHDEKVKNMRIERKRRILQKLRCMRRAAQTRKEENWMIIEKIMHKIVEEVVETESGLLKGGSTIIRGASTLQEPTEIGGEEDDDVQGGEDGWDQHGQVQGEDDAQEGEDGWDQYGQVQGEDEDHHQADLLGSDEGELPGWAKVPYKGRAYHEFQQGSNASHKAGRLTGPEERAVVPLEERGA